MSEVNIIPFEIEVVSPINYYFIPAAGGMRSSNFIGDIALKYAMLHQMGELNYVSPTKFKPTYEELLKFPFWFTVAVNEKLAFGKGRDTIFMKNMVRNTMQGIDYNGTNSYPGFKEGSKMYKNFYFQQPLKPGNQFYVYFISKNGEAEVPSVMRIGNNKTGIITLRKHLGEPFDAMINAYTFRNILGKDIPNINYNYTNHVVLQYFLLGMLSRDEVSKAYAQP